MSKPVLRLLLSVAVMGTSGSHGQDTQIAAPPVNNGKGGSLSSALSLGDMLQSATELRQAAECLERFGDSMVKVSAVAERSVVSGSENLAAIGGEFDPFGFKTAFQTIQQQNEIIQAQHQMIIELQQQEIQRLRQQLKQRQTKQKSGQAKSKQNRKPTTDN